MRVHAEKALSAYVVGQAVEAEEVLSRGQAAVELEMPVVEVRIRMAFARTVVV